MLSEHVAKTFQRLISTNDIYFYDNISSQFHKSFLGELPRAESQPD